MFRWNNPCFAASFPSSYSWAHFLSLFNSPEQKAYWWAYRIGRPQSSVVRQSVVCLSVCHPHSLNIFSSETAWPIKVKFYMEPPWDGGMKVCSNGPGHMTKMAAIPMCGKNLKKSSLEPKGRWLWKLVWHIGCSSTTKFVQMMTLSWPWAILRQGQIWSLTLLYEKR